MQHFLPTGLTKSVSPLMVSISKTFRTLLLASGLLIVFSMQTQAQVQDEWTLDTTVNNVEFMYQIVDCGFNKAVLLKFDNKNDFDVRVSWKHIIGSKQMANSTQESPESFEMLLPSGVTAPSSCEDQDNDVLVVLATEVDPTFIADIENYSFSSISVGNN